MAPTDKCLYHLSLDYLSFNRIDREQMVKTILRGYGTVGNDHPIAEANRYHASALEQRQFDPDRAKFHLKKAGAGDIAFDLSAAEASFVGAVDAAVLYKESAAKAGITINVVREPNDGYWSNVWMKKPWCAVFWGGRPTEDMMFSTAYAADADWNDTFWKNPRFNELLVAARAELDENRRREMYVEMQSLVRDDGGVVVPMFAADLSAASDKIGHGKLGVNWELDGFRCACAGGLSKMSPLVALTLKRLGLGALTLLVISVLIFVGIELLPGDLAEEILGQNATPETVAAFRRELKLDLPPHVRYLAWLGDLSRGNLLNSWANGRPIVDLIGWRFANTLFLAAATAVVAIPVSILLGILAALHRNSLFDRFISMATLSTISFPEFCVAYILIALLSVQLIIFPSVSNINDQMSLWEKMYAIMLPCLTLTMVVVAHMMRQTRAAIINILSSPFIEMAHLKGLKRVHGGAARVSQCAVSGDQRGGAQSGLPGGRRGDRRGGLRLSGGALRGREAAHLHRPGPGRQSRSDHLRRGDLGPGPSGGRGNPEVAATPSK